jgi:hypothetical protein
MEGGLVVESQLKSALLPKNKKGGGKKENIKDRLKCVIRNKSGLLLNWSLQPSTAPLLMRNFDLWFVS